MKLKGILTDDFVNYKRPCMILEFPYCDFKCDKECGKPVCQNSALASAPDLKFSLQEIKEMYLKHPLHEAIVCQGLEPLDSFSDLISFIENFRTYSKDKIIIFTGFEKNEIQEELEQIIKSGKSNIIIKFGRYIPNQNPITDPILGIELASPNQYAEEFKNE